MYQYVIPLVCVTGTVPQSEVKEKTTKEKLLEKKRRLKEMFDAEYDEKGNGDHFDALKTEMSQQAQVSVCV